MPDYEALMGLLAQRQAAPPMVGPPDPAGVGNLQGGELEDITRAMPALHPAMRESFKQWLRRKLAEKDQEIQQLEMRLGRRMGA